MNILTTKQELYRKIEKLTTSTPKYQLLLSSFSPLPTQKPFYFKLLKKLLIAQQPNTIFAQENETLERDLDPKNTSDIHCKNN